MDTIFKKRHSLAHLLAMAVLKEFPEAKLTIGPPIETGFYYDIAMPEGQAISADMLPALTKAVRKLVKQDLIFVKKDISEAEARGQFKENPFKIELIDDLAKNGDSLTIYETQTQDGKVIFSDLCAGEHVQSTKEIDPESFAINRVAGAYWRGDEKNQMLTRIYGLAFETKEELEQYLANLEEAKKRDHKILGPALKLYSTSPLIGAGLPLIQPRGMVIRKAIEDYLWELHAEKGYDRVWTPHIAKEALYQTSGHAEKFGDELFRVQGKEEKFFMKPMNCPHHMQIFADNQFSYRDMPVRYFEPATVYRDEKSGQLGGLTRVRAITQDDGHLFCRSSQINDEAKTIVSIIKQFYKTMGMLDGYWVRLSLRGENKSDYLGSDEIWQTAEDALRNVCKEEALPYKEVAGEAAFYGPKLDFMFKDSIGREWQLATIQCDFNLPEKFNLSFINEKGEKERPVVIHRAISGSLERFMGVMIEHFAGAFPLWLSPVQVSIVPVKDVHNDFAEKLSKELKSAGIRPEFDSSNDSFGKKIRNAKTSKVPYIVVIGDAEVSAESITLEGRGGEKIGPIKIAEAVEKLKKDTQERSIN